MVIRDNYRISGGRFDDETSRSGEHAMEGLRRYGLDGVQLEGPRQVLLKTPLVIPLTGGRRCSIGDNRRRSLEKQAIVVAVDMDTGQLFAGPAFKQQHSLNRRTPPVGRHLPGGMMTRRFSIDLKNRIPRLPFRPAVYAVSIILFKRRSNTIITRLVSGNPDPEVVRFIRRFRCKTYPEAISPVPGSPYPRYGDRATQVPEAVGITIRADDAHGPRQGAKLIVRGGFRLPVHPWQLAGPRWSAPDPVVQRVGQSAMSHRYGCDGLLKEIGRADVGDPGATAILPITLLLTGNELSGPWQLPLRVPTHDVIRSAAKLSPVTGTFSVDMLSLPGTVCIPQKYALWAFYGSVVSNVCEVRLV